MKMKTDFSTVEFIEPSISISWNLKEEDLVDFLKCGQNESHTYKFEAKLYPVNKDVFTFITFNEKGFKLEVISYELIVERQQGSKVIYTSENINSTLKNYIKEKIGSPKIISRLFSIFDKPFYNHQWTFDKLKVTHKYQDSVGGFYESLTFDVKY